MKYVLLICNDESWLPSMEELEQDPVNQAFSAAVAERNADRGGERLRPSTEATTVRVREGKVLVTDGPFAETKDLVGGISILECADLDEAIEIASKHPYALAGSVEIRPVWE
jgi:hypothetical protein